MFISGFTYVRNGLKMGYPFLASIQSLLPLVDELIVVVGDSEDGSNESVLALQADKIKIIDSIWSEEQRQNGAIFKKQADLGLLAAKGDWLIHLQADGVLHKQNRA